MRMNVHGLKNMGKFILFLPVMTILGTGYFLLAETLDGLILGTEAASVGSAFLALMILAVYFFVCLRANWDELYFYSVLLAVFNLLVSDFSFVTKFILIPVALVGMVLHIKLQAKREIGRVVPKRKAKTTPNAAPVVRPITPILSVDAEYRYQKTLGKLPYDPLAFRNYCASLPQGAAQRMAKEDPVRFFQNVPCRESLQYIYVQNPENAMVLVDVYIKFDANGQLIAN